MVYLIISEGNPLFMAMDSRLLWLIKRTLIGYRCVKHKFTS